MLETSEHRAWRPPPHFSPLGAAKLASPDLSDPPPWCSCSASWACSHLSHHTFWSSGTALLYHSKSFLSTFKTHSWFTVFGIHAEFGFRHVLFHLLVFTTATCNSRLCRYLSSVSVLLTLGFTSSDTTCPILTYSFSQLTVSSTYHVPGTGPDTEFKHGTHLYLCGALA